MKTEILLGVIQNLSCISFGIVISWGSIIAIGMFSYAISYDDEEKERNLSFIKKAFGYYPLIIILLLMSALPTVDSLWKIRISLIKLELASPDNIKKGADEISKIAKKLECKYLGCDEEKKK